MKRASQNWSQTFPLRSLRSRSFLAGFAACALLVLSGCADRRDPANLVKGTGKTLIEQQLPEFQFTDQDGRERSLAEYEGKPFLLNLIFLRCPTHCKEMSAKWKELQDRTPELKDLKLVSVSVDPEDDTPAKMKAYGEKYGADFSRWTFARGTKEDVSRLRTAGLLETGDRNNHSQRTYLIGADGKMLLRYDTFVPEEFELLISDMNTLLGD